MSPVRCGKLPVKRLKVPPVPQGSADPIATGDFLKNMTVLDTIAAGILADKTTRSTARVMALRERREIAVSIARVRGVDVDGKRLQAPTKPDEADRPPLAPTLRIDLSALPDEMRERILAQNASKIIAEDEDVDPTAN